MPYTATVAAGDAVTTAVTNPTTAPTSQDAVAGSEETRRVLGSSVVTSVSVIADGEGLGEGVSNATSTRTYSADPPARPARPQQRLPSPAQAQGLKKWPQGGHAQAGGPVTVGSPAGLMSPDRYEFYTFDETGDLVRRHMTLDEIKSLLAGGDGDLGDTPVATFYHGPVPAPSRAPVHHHQHHHNHHHSQHQGVIGGLEDPEDALEDAVKGVQDVVNNVQNVLKSQLAASKNKLPAYIRPPPAAAQPSHSEAAANWGMILPGIMEGGLPPRPPHGALPPTPRPTANKTKKPTLAATTAKKPAKKPITTTAPTKDESPPTRSPTTTEQDIVDTLYTLVSSSPGLPPPTAAVKNTASNNASNPLPQPHPHPPPVRAPSPTTPPPRPAPFKPQRPPIPQRPATARPAATTAHRTGSKPTGRPTTRPAATKPATAKPTATKPAPTKPAPTKPAPTKPVFTKPVPTKPVPTKPAFAKPLTKPFRPATAESVQQRRPFPHDDQQPQQQQHAESMVQIVTIQRPAPTTTMTPFVTFIPTVTTTAAQTTSPPTTLPPTTTPLTSRRPPAMSYTYRMTTTGAPPPTETVSSADLDMDSRTTDDEEEATVTTTGTVPTSSSSTSSATPSTSTTTVTSTTSYPTTTSPTTLPFTTWMTSVPTSVSTRIATTAGLLPTRITTFATTTDAPSGGDTTVTTAESTDATLPPVYSTTVAAPGAPETTEPEVKPVRYTEILTRVPASALVTKRVTEDDVEQTSTAASTMREPTTERADEIAMTTSGHPVEAVTMLDEADEEDEEDENDEDVGAEEQSGESTEAETTTKLYLKISSSETNSPLYSTSFSTDTSAAESLVETVTPTIDAETRTTAETSWETVAVTDQSAASTELRGTEVSTTAAPTSAAPTTATPTTATPTTATPTTATPTTATPTTAVPTTASEDVESRTEMLDLDTTDATATSTMTSPSFPSTSAVSEAEALTATTSPPTSSSATPSSPEAAATSELSLESSNIQTSQVDAPQASSLRMASTTSAPTTAAVDVEANKVDTEATSSSSSPSSTSTSSNLATQSQALWTRIPVVSSAEDESASAHADGPAHPGPGAVKAGEEEAVKHAGVFHAQPSSGVELQAAPQEHLGLEAATASLDPDVRSFVNLCNDLAFQMWMAVKDRAGSATVRSIVMSPFAATSTLAMVFLGARGPTSGQMNDVLRLDDMVSFNPHQVLWNVTEALVRPRSKNTGVATAALVRELYSDKNKGKLLDFYKERAQQFYDGHVEEITFRNSGDLVRRKTNLLVKRQTRGRVQEYMRGASLALRGPLAAFGANIFETDCTGASTEGRDGEMHFVVVPSSRQRRLVPVPAAVWRSGFLAGYDPSLDATAVAMGPADAAFSTVLVLPGQQGHVAPGDGLSRLEQRLLESRGPGARWARLLRSLLPRPGLELQVPRFSHRSVLNMSEALQRMGLDELFSSEHADLRGLNGVANDLHLSDVVQLNTFSTCGERAVDSRHHVEFYPTSPLASPGRRAARGRRLRPRVAEADGPSIELHPDNVGKDRDAFYARVGDALEAAEARGSSGLTSSEEATASEDTSSPSSSSSGSREARTFQRIADFEDPDLMKVPLALRPRQARIPEAARLRFDRPFLFFVRHNPTGVLLHMGRFNPRLLP